MLDLIRSPVTKYKKLTGKSKPQSKPQKIQAVENITITIPVYKPKKVVIELSQELEDLELDLDNKNHRKTVKKVMSAIKISNKIYKLITYQEAISDLVYF